MDIKRVGPAKEDMLIRPDEWVLLLDDEAFRQLVKSKYSEQMELMILKDETRQTAIARASVVNHMSKYISVLQKYAENSVDSHTQVCMIRLCWSCWKMPDNPLPVSGRHVCVFTGMPSEHAYEVQFHSLEPGALSISESEKYVVSRTYLMLLKCCYILSHTFGFITECVRAEARAKAEKAKADAAKKEEEDTDMNATKEEKVEAEDQPTTTQKKLTELERVEAMKQRAFTTINEAARVVYCFFQRKRRSPESHNECICHLERAFRNTTLR